MAFTGSEMAIGKMANSHRDEYTPDDTGFKSQLSLVEKGLIQAVFGDAIAKRVARNTQRLRGLDLVAIEMLETR